MASVVSFHSAAKSSAGVGADGTLLNTEVAQNVLAALSIAVKPMVSGSRVTLPGGAVVTASVTNDAVDALALAVGQPATAVFKAYAVMIAVRDE